jgi:hypothetical protein
MASSSMTARRPSISYSNEPDWQKGDKPIVHGKTFLVLRVEPGESGETYRVLVVKRSTDSTIGLEAVSARQRGSTHRAHARRLVGKRRR